MGPVQRFILGAGASVMCVALTSMPGFAASKTTKPKPVPPPPAPPAMAHKLAAALPPQVFLVNPVRVNPTKQPNIIITGQYLSVRTTVQVGGRPATTIESPDPQTLLVQLPTDLTKGSYAVSVTNEAGTAVADEQLVVDDSGTAPSTLTMVAGAGFLLLFGLVARLARTPGLG